MLQDNSTEENETQKNMVESQLMVSQDVFCRKCNSLSIQNPVHCPTCDVCYSARMHHCQWIGKVLVISVLQGEIILSFFCSWLWFLPILLWYFYSDWLWPFLVSLNKNFVQFLFFFGKWVLFCFPLCIYQRLFILFIY